MCCTPHKNSWIVCHTHLPDNIRTRWYNPASFDQTGESALRSIHNFNDDWLYLPEDAASNRPNSDFELVTLPHTNIVLPYHNFDNREYQFISTYRKHFRLPEPRSGRRVYVDFDGAMIASTVSINGHVLGDYEGGYTPFSFDLTDYLNDDGDNLLTVRLDSTERPDIPPYGGVVDYLTFGGIYRDVHLRYVEPVHIADVFVRTKNVLTEHPEVEVDITLENQTGAQIKQLVTAMLMTPDVDDRVVRQARVTVEAHEKATHTLCFDGLPPKKLWEPHQPVLHYMQVVSQADADSSEVDHVNVPFGFREAQFRDDGFYLNGEKLKLMGLNRHQTYPYIGAAAPKRLQEKDADIIKYELGCNIVRTSHYPQSPHFLRRCDEIGLLVFEEIPGWQHIGDEDWQGISLRDVEAMIVRDRNHPSIVLWGVRINESQDNTAFYTRTNELAHKLDPTRQTGGVRFWQHSEFLEDVYTFNDFSNSIQEPVQTPHLVTEFSGHMYPTKTFDQEERAVEHALRHARIQDKQLGMDNVAGAIGWCAFDYNTHREFGSGDRICYHGVMDMFRLPKFAAYVYESQIDPAVRPVLQAATYWTMGDRSEGGINPLMVFSNCDEIEMFTGDQRIGRYQPDREQFPNLPHAPFTIKGLNLLWGGHKFEDLRLVGYVSGEAVIEQHISGDGIPKKLVLEVDDPELKADGADITRLVFKITDQYGNRLPYAMQPVSFEISGPAQLIGENPFALAGGQAALYIKAGREPGTVTVRATTARLAAAEVRVTIK
jgi:beta-galactosidase